MLMESICSSLFLASSLFFAGCTLHLHMLLLKLMLLLCLVIVASSHSDCHGHWGRGLLSGCNEFRERC